MSKETKARVEKQYWEYLKLFNINNHYRTLKCQLQADKILTDNGINNIRFIKRTYSEEDISTLYYQDVPDEFEVGYFFQIDERRNSLVVYYKNGELKHSTLHRYNYSISENYNQEFEDIKITSNLEHCIEQIKSLVKFPMGYEMENYRRLSIFSQSRDAWRKYNKEGELDYIGLAEEILTEFNCKGIKFSLIENETEISGYFIANGIKILKIFKNKKDIDSMFSVISMGEGHILTNVLRASSEIAWLFSVK